MVEDAAGIYTRGSGLQSLHFCSSWSRAVPLRNDYDEPLKIKKRFWLIVPPLLSAICFKAGVAFAAIDTVRAGSTPTAPDSLEWVFHIPPNGDEEVYLRYLQIAGTVPLFPWSLRGYSQTEARKLAAKTGTHPWSGSGPFTSRERRARLLPLVAELRGTSSIPYGSNDGPVWAGRGVTFVASAGAALHAGPVSLTLAPTGFITQNAEFDLLANGQTGDLRFADGVYPHTVDRPQRFGEHAYGRMDPGNSTLRADVGPAAAGISTANMAWGPMELYPYIIGTNAAGFLHAFVGTSRPISVWIGSLHGRVIWGRLEQSEYSPVRGEDTYVSPQEPGTRRFASGLVALFEPRGTRGLELGVARFFHSPWPREGVPSSYFRKPFEDILKSGLKGAPGFGDPGTTGDNQLISGFLRWAFPAAGAEVYAEYGREDHSWDKRDFLQEPDHSRSYGLGFRKVLRLRPDLMDGLTIELINFQLPHLARTGRGEGSVYIHAVMRQGHTNRGQLLGADVGVGSAAGSTIRWDRYRAQGSVTLSLQRTVRQQRGTYFLDGVEVPKSSDVQYVLEGVRMRRFRRADVTAGVAVIHGLNRNFREDVTSFSVVLRARMPL